MLDHNPYFSLLGLHLHHLTHCHPGKGVGDREFLEKYLNSASKNTSETEIFPHGIKSLLTSVISTSGVVRKSRNWISHYRTFDFLEVLIGSHVTR